MSDLAQCIGALEDVLKHRDKRITELKAELDGARALVADMEEREYHEITESWIEVFDMRRTGDGKVLMWASFVEERTISCTSTTIWFASGIRWSRNTTRCGAEEYWPPAGGKRGAMPRSPAAPQVWRLVARHRRSDRASASHDPDHHRQAERHRSHQQTDERPTQA